MMLCRNGKKVLPFPIERGLTRMTDNQQQPYGSDSVPQPAQPAQPAQPSYGQDAAQQPQGYGASMFLHYQRGFNVKFEGIGANQY